MFSNLEHWTQWLFLAIGLTPLVGLIFAFGMEMYTHEQDKKEHDNETQ